MKDVEPPTTRRYLSVKDFAVTYGISSATVYAMVAAKKLPHVRFGNGRGTIRIPADGMLPITPAEAVPAPKVIAPPPRRVKLQHLRLPS